jgi:hypothetical protein
MVKKLIQKNYLLYGLNNLKNKQIMKNEIIEEAKKVYQKALQDNIELSFYDGVNLGAELQAKRMYSESEVIILLNKFGSKVYGDYTRNTTMEEFCDRWFKQNKKK